MARFEDGKVTLVMDGEDVDTFDWNNEDDRKELLRRADQGTWSMKNKDKIKSWQATAEEYTKNKDQIALALNFANQLDRIKNGHESPDGFIEQLEKYGIKITDKQAKDFDDGDLDPVSEKLLKKIELLEGKVTKYEKNSLNTESVLFNNQSEAAHKENQSMFSAKPGYPKYDPSEIEDYMVKNGENAIYHPDVKKQYQLIYKEINETKILEAERLYGGLSEAERKAKIKEAQGEKGGGGNGVKPKPYKPVPGDRNYDAAAKAVLEEMKSSGKSFIVED